jgi:hypothetical protein
MKRVRDAFYTARVRRLFGWMAGLVGIAALARVLARRRRPRRPQTLSSPGNAPDPAEELRRKLTETRAGSTVEPASTSVPTSSPPPQESLEERRSRVHAKAQEAIEAMQDPPA